MAEFHHGPEVNLEELRNQLTKRLAVTLIAASIFLIWLRLLLWAVRPRYFPSVEFSLMAILLGLAIGVWMQASVRPILARRLLLWGLTIELLVVMWLFPEPWLPFLGLALILVGALLVSGGGWLTASAVAVLAGWLAGSGVRSYPLLQLLITLGFGATLAWLVARTFYTALGWAWTMQQRADYLLELARDRQAELSRALKSLKNSNTMLCRMQRELIIARRHAEEARLLKEQFAANISHELRTPLSLILGFSEVMCLSSEVYGEMEWSPALRQDVYQIYRNSRHLLEMIDDVLDLSRLEMVGFTLNKEPTSLEPLLRDTAEIVVHLFRNRSVSLEVEVEPNLPLLEIDVTRIRQVLLNLLNNAARFTEQGRVRVEASRIDGDVMISVSDTGPGIPADKLPFVFDEFYQVDLSLHRQHGGAGLGLAISKHFVEAHDGRIWVESQEGAGSTFTFTLPMPEHRIPVSRPYITSRVEPSWANGPSPILFVDPDPETVDMVQRHLGGREVVHVQNANRLTEAVMLHHPQAVVYNLAPGERAKVDGVLSASVPFVECSLPSRAWAKDHLSVIGYLNKPIVAEHLLREIEQVGDVQDVLVVDDERGFCQLVERILKSSDFSLKLRQVYSGEKGLQAMRERRPDLVLLDLIMPGVDGFQVLEAMQRDPELADVPVVL
jgi:signal transduction histidine kinase